MVKQLKQYITEQQLFQPAQRILLAVSGGVDSVVLCHLFQQLGYHFGIAHCNFQLRGAESDADLTFVKHLADKLDVPFFSKNFDTEKVAQQQKISIQMAARDLRYDWLEQVRSNENFDYIATAHHLNDSIETVLYNFAKGCGIRGLHGILPKVNQIIRPLLFATKSEIEAFAKKENITFRYDASNALDKYDRNKLRHHVIPILQELNPNFEQTAAHTLDHLRQAEALYDFALATLQDNWVQEQEGKLLIALPDLLQHPAASTILYEWLKPFGFHPDQVAQLLESAQRQAGGLFFSATHKLLIDREQLIVQSLKEATEEAVYTVHKKEVVSLKTGILRINGPVDCPTTFAESENVVYLDYDKLAFPLKVRRWQAGDVFQPLGMQGKHQKLQDFFTNQKLSRFEKEQVWLLESDEKICWIVGYRLDERFKITATTRACLHLEWQPV